MKADAVTSPNSRGLLGVNVVVPSPPKMSPKNRHFLLRSSRYVSFFAFLVPAAFWAWIFLDTTPKFLSKGGRSEGPPWPALFFGFGGSFLYDEEQI